MEILQRLKVPTGDILVVQGEKGKLEMCSLFDYGKSVNTKADFLGMAPKSGKVEHGDLLPLEDKWVIRISTQYGCSMGCTFCDVPKIGPGTNATVDDLCNQIATALDLHPGITSLRHLGVHFTRFGEPTFNPGVLDVAEGLARLDIPFGETRGKIHALVAEQRRQTGDKAGAHPRSGASLPILSRYSGRFSRINVLPLVATMMPRHNEHLRTFIERWVEIKNGLFDGFASLKLSINSTNEDERAMMFGGNACTLEEISRIMHGIRPLGRKIALNFPVAGWEIDPSVLLRHFDPALFFIRLTPVNQTAEAVRNGLKTAGACREFRTFSEHEERLKGAGYDVQIFIPSDHEDRGRITLGNAILSGTRPLCRHETV